jgi:translation initiation factor 5B
MLRSPICTILGHVDSGKTSLLDILRDSGVQGKEAGGITQKIGTSYMTKNTIETLTREINKEIKIPGIIFVDTPGHAVFSNQRICGLMISDIIILVVDILRGIEEQTIECINMLLENKRPFIIAANKIDRINGWTPTNNICALKSTYKNQKKKSMEMLEQYLDKLSKQLLMYGYVSAPYYKNDNVKQNISIVPLSAKTGEGISDIIMLLNVFAEKYMTKRLEVKSEFNKGYIVEKIKDKRHGNIVSAILIDGNIKQGDILMSINDNDEIIKHKIDHLYEPDECDEVKDSLNIRLIESMNKQLPFLMKFKDDINFKPGSQFYIITENNSKYQELLENYKCKNTAINKVKLSKYGIQINAKTYSSAQALGELCNSKNIPVSKLTIGNLNKKDLMKLTTKYLNTNKTDDELLINKRHMVILCYDTTIDSDLNKMAIDNNIKIISNQIIYKIIEEYEQYVETLNQSLKNNHPNLRPQVELKIIEKFVFHKKDPLLFGVTVMKNKLHMAMIIETISDKGLITLGKITSIQRNNKSVDEAKEKEEVCIKIELINDKDNRYEYGKDFNAKNILKSSIGKNEKELLEKYPEIFN